MATLQGMANLLQYVNKNVPVVGGQPYTQTFDCGTVSPSTIGGCICILCAVFDCSNLPDTDEINGMQIAYTTPEGQQETEDLTNALFLGPVTGGEEVRCGLVPIGILPGTDFSITLEITAVGGGNPPANGTFNIHVALFFLMPH